jgi:hypothetical protein
MNVDVNECTSYCSNVNERTTYCSNVIERASYCYNVNEHTSSCYNVSECFCDKSIESKYSNYGNKGKVHVDLIHNVNMMSSLLQVQMSGFYSRHYQIF